MAVAISYVDNGDGTGGTINVSGSPAGATNTVRYLKFAGGYGSSDWITGPSRVGDGPIVFAATSGPYHAFVSSDVAGVITYGAPLGFRVFDAVEALHYRFADALRDWMLGLNIAGVPTDPEQHVVTKVGAKLDTILDGKTDRSVLYYIPVTESFFRADNQFDTCRFPVVIAWLIESSQLLKKHHTEILKWREIVHLSHSACRLALDEVWGIEFQPGSVVDPSKWLAGYDSSVITLIGISEQKSGLV